MFAAVSRFFVDDRTTGGFVLGIVSGLALLGHILLEPFANRFNTNAEGASLVVLSLTFLMQAYAATRETAAAAAAAAVAASGSGSDGEDAVDGAAFGAELALLVLNGLFFVGLLVAGRTYLWAALRTAVDQCTARKDATGAPALDTADFSSLTGGGGGGGGRNNGAPLPSSSSSSSSASYYSTTSS